MDSDFIRASALQLESIERFTADMQNKISARTPPHFQNAGATQETVSVHEPAEQVVQA